MELLVVLALFFWVMNVAKKGKQAAQTHSSQSPHPRQPQSHESKASAPAAPKAKPAAGQTSEGSSQGYVPMQTHMQDLLQQQQPKKAAEYVGSLGGGSTEGYDPCHDPMEHTQPTADEIYAERSAQTSSFPWTQNALVQGVVMSEILTRPSQRRQRRF